MKSLNFDRLRKGITCLKSLATKQANAMKFEWDDEKRQQNTSKHGVDLIHAALIFEEPTLTKIDNRLDYGEERFISLVADFSQIVPYLADGKEAFKVCRPAAGLCNFSFVQFNEFRDRLLSPLDGIVDAAPESASIKWTLMSRTCH